MSLSFAVVYDLGRTETVKRPVIKVDHPDERTGIVEVHANRTRRAEWSSLDSYHCSRNTSHFKCENITNKKADCVPRFAAKARERLCQPFTRLSDPACQLPEHRLLGSIIGV